MSALLDAVARVRKGLSQLAKAWSEDDHPRDADGKFGGGGGAITGAGNSKVAEKPEKKKGGKTRWPSLKATALLAALHRIGWTDGQQAGSHLKLTRPGSPGYYTFAFHGGHEVGSVMVGKVAKATGLTIDDL